MTAHYLAEWIPVWLFEGKTMDDVFLERFLALYIRCNVNGSYRNDAEGRFEWMNFQTDYPRNEQGLGHRVLKVTHTHGPSSDFNDTRNIQDVYSFGTHADEKTLLGKYNSMSDEVKTRIRENPTWDEMMEFMWDYCWLDEE